MQLSLLLFHAGTMQSETLTTVMTVKGEKKEGAASFSITKCEKMF